MTVTRADPPELKRQFPHVDDIADWRAQQSLRLLWERIFDLEARLQAGETTLGDLVKASNRQDDDLRLAHAKGDEALALAQLLASERARLDGGGGDGGGPPVGPLVWAWSDFGGPTIDSPYATGPQTAADYKTYFFTLIGRSEGDPATDDWEAVLTASGIPAGLPAGVIPNDTMPHWAMTQQVGAAGVRGRVFLPTSTPDDLLYYAHPFDVLASAP